MDEHAPANDWDELAAIFTGALEVPPADRDAWLERACAGRAALRDEVAAMLLADADGARLAIEEQLLSDADPTFAEGTDLGGHRILRWLGRGGMGDVYLGVRPGEASEDLVAIKVLRRGISGAGAAARFGRERRILANLAHPAIVPLLGNGVTPDGRPYLVLQYVDGAPITAYCDSLRLPIDARLRLFIAVCRAVQYAHVRLIVHRDLKPSNILVTKDGEARLLDFGIAKALSPDEEETDLTHQDGAPMTPERAAPEQLRGEVPSTATDVWALGVLLQELLTGRLPFAVAGRSRADIERAVSGQDAVAASTAIRLLHSSDPAAARGIAASRATSVDRLRGALRGDLDTVIAAALRREPERRYASAGHFADDVERFLGGQPVLARPHGVGYRLRRFIGRNPAAVAATAVAIVLLAAFSVSTALQSAEVKRQRDRAAAEEMKANAVVDLLTEVLGGADPTAGASGPTIDIAELLARGEKRAGELEAQPAVQARLWHVLGKIQHERSGFAKARTLLTQAYAKQVELEGPDDARAQEIAIDLARTDRTLGFRSAAETRLRALLVRLDRQPPPRPALLAAALDELSNVASVREKERLIERSLELRRAIVPADSNAIAESLNSLGILAAERGARDPAIRHYRESLAILHGSVGASHPYALAVQSNLAAVVAEPAEQETIYRSLIAAHTKRVGDRSAPVAMAWNNLGTALARQGKLDAALAAYSRSRDLWAHLGGADHPMALNPRRSIAVVLELKGRPEESLSELRAILDAAARRGAEPVTIASLHAQAGGVLFHLDRLAEARRELQPAVDELRRLEPVGGPHRTSAELGLGLLLLAEGRSSEARSELASVVAARQKNLPAGDPYLAEANVALGRALIADGRSAEGRQLIARNLEPLSRHGLAHPHDVEAARRAMELR
jgi:eukaryotic-like serine/threonine-protein kinase